MGIELAKAFVTVRGDMSRLRGDFTKIRGVVTREMGRIALAANRAAASVGASVTRIGLAVSGMLVGATKLSFDFQDQMTAVRNLVLDMADKDFKKLEDGVRSMAREFGRGTGQIAGGMFEIISAGGDVNSVLDDMKKLMPLVVAGQADMGQAIKLVGTIINSYNLSWKETGRVSDLIFKINEKGVTTVTDLAGSMGFVADMASNLNISLEELSAALATATKGAPTTSIAVTRLAALMRALAAGTDDVNKIFKKHGVASGEMALKQLGLAKSAKILFDETNGSVGALTKLLGRAEAVQGVLSIAGRKAALMAENMEAMANATGTAEAALKKAQEQGVEKFRQAKERLIDVLREVGQRLMPNIIKMFNSLNATLKKNADVIASKLTPIFQSLLSLVGSVGSKFLEMRSAIEKIAESLKSFFGPLFDFVKRHPEIIAAFLALKVTGFLGINAAIRDMAILLTTTLVAAVNIAMVAITAFGIELNLLTAGIPLLIGALVTGGVALGAFALQDKELRDELAELFRQIKDDLGPALLELAKAIADVAKELLPLVTPVIIAGVKTLAVVFTLLAKQTALWADALAKGRKLLPGLSGLSGLIPQQKKGVGSFAVGKERKVPAGKGLDAFITRHFKSKGDLVPSSVGGTSVVPAVATAGGGGATAAIRPLLDEVRFTFARLGTSIQDALLRPKETEDTKQTAILTDSRNIQKQLLEQVQKNKQGGGLT